MAEFTKAACQGSPGFPGWLALLRGRVGHSDWETGFCALLVTSFSVYRRFLLYVDSKVSTCYVPGSVLCAGGSDEGGKLSPCH